MMPVMNGFEFREEQKAAPELRNIPVVIFTAAGVHGSIDDVTVLPKPVDTNRLLDALTAVAPLPNLDRDSR